MPAQGSRRHGPPADKYATSFRRQFRVVTIFLLAVNLTIGLFARHQQHAIIDYAVTIYDTAFISTNYVSLAQISFQHYIDERFRGAGPAQTSEANELLETVLDDMDVAVERSSSAQTREKGQGIRACRRATISKRFPTSPICCCCARFSPASCWRVWCCS